MAQEEARYQRNPDFIFRTIVDEAVLVPIRQQVAEMDCIYTLNAVGAVVWQKLDTPATETELQNGHHGRVRGRTGCRGCRPRSRFCAG